MLQRWKKFRTPVLGVISVSMLVGGAVWIFDVPARDIGEILLASISVVAIVVCCALVMGYLLNRLRH